MKSIKGLEDLKWLVENGYIKEHGWQEDEIMLDCVDNIENELKALEIIKKKNVDIFTFKIAGCLERYNEKRMFGSSLTKEEYDLLKEVLK